MLQELLENTNHLEELLADGFEYQSHLIIEAL